MTWVDLLLLLILACGITTFGRRRLRKHNPVYKGVERGFASHCALSIEESPLLQLGSAPDGATPRYLVVDTETVCYLHDTLDKTQLSSIDTPLLASLSWLLLDEELRVVRSEDHLLLSGIPITSEATDYHQLTTEFVAGHGEAPQAVLELFLRDLESVQMLVGHSLAFHLAILAHDLQHYQLPSESLWSRRQFCTMRQGINYLISHYQADPLQTRISLESLYSKLLWGREELEIIYQLKSRHDVVLATHCFIKLYRDPTTADS
ncbi:exonuclease [uncultured Porphyromonas sp.]|uniref:exonuclease n=1 Tax=uncultured Porphyromonas sp. TaxID=159274 RepID=UPI002804AEA4|nr:exonuclease [uncultured Porphyromonas sp.]